MGRFALYLVLIFTPLYGQSLYLSDGLGNELQPLEALSGEEEWYLSNSENSLIRVRILYHNQSEIKRWESRTRSGETDRTIETYFYKSRLREINEYNSRGQLLSEQFYDSDGNFLEHRIYRLNEQKRVTDLLILDEEGLTLKSHAFLYRENGSLREITGRTSEGEPLNRILWRSQDYDSRFLEQVYLENGTTASLYSYEAGRLKIRSAYKDNKETERTLYTYSPDGLSTETTWDYAEDSLEVLYYDKQSRVVLENSFKKGILRVSIAREFQEEELIRYEERSTGEKILWEYEYSKDQDDPVLSTFYRNGVLVKKIQREDGMIKETIFRNNQPVYETISETTEEGGDS